MTRHYLLAVALLLLLAGIWFYGSVQYKKGVLETVAQYQKADREGAQNARDIAEEVIRSLTGDFDPDELLVNTDGLRD